jgi:hypothetical protein
MPPRTKSDPVDHTQLANKRSGSSIFLNSLQSVTPQKRELIKNAIVSHNTVLSPFHWIFVAKKKNEITAIIYPNQIFCSRVLR